MIAEGGALLTWSGNAGTNACENCEQWQQALAYLKERRLASLEPAGMSSAQWLRTLSLFSEVREIARQ